MYDLTKRKNIGLHITFGVIVFAFITMVLKMAFYKRPTSFDKGLISAANEINKRTPIIIDSTTRFDSVNVLPGKIFRYNYTIATMDREEVDTAILKIAAKENLLQLIKANPKSSGLRDNNVEIQVRYSDKNGKYITAVSLHANEY